MIQIDWKPDRNKHDSIKKQIIDHMREKINTGAWPLGSKLPSQRYLAERFEVNRSTVIAAFEVLKSDLLISGKGKSGMKIIAASTPLITMSQTKWQDYIEEGIHLPNYKTIKMINDSDPDINMLRLSSGEASPELFPTEYMNEVLASIANDMGHLGYEWPTGMRCLQEALCDHLKKKDIHVSPQNILIVSGALQGFQLITMGLLQMGSTVFVEKPSYLYSLQILQTLGMRRVGIPIDKDGIISRDIPSQIPKNHASILYTIPNFQNPTGTVMSLERRKELLKVCYDSKLPIIEDDVYGDLWIDEEPPKSLKSMDEIGNVLYVGSVSKTLSPGLRIGWVVGPETVINRLADIKMQMDYGSSSVSQLIVAKWLSSGLYEKHLIEVRKELRKRRDFTLELLEAYYSDFATWDMPRGGSYIWITLKESLSMYKIFETAFQEKILFNPGYIYESTSNNAFRISYSFASYDQLKDGLIRLACIIRNKG